MIYHTTTISHRFGPHAHPQEAQFREGWTSAAAAHAPMVTTPSSLSRPSSALQPPLTTLLCTKTISNNQGSPAYNLDK